MISKYSFFVFAFLCAFVSGFGQVTIYYENMYNGTGGASGNAIATHETNNRFNEDALTYSGTGDMRTTNESTEVSGTYPGASGTYNVLLNADSEHFVMDGLNLNAYSSITLSFGIRKNTTAEDGSNLIVEYSTSGPSGPYTAITIPPLPTGSGTAIWHYRTSTSVIPSNTTTIQFSSSYSTNQWRIDDILLEGIACTDAVDWANIQFPTSSPQTITDGNNFDVYAQVYELGVTNPMGQALNINAWIGYNTTNNNPASVGWTWVPANYNAAAECCAGNNDEYFVDIGSGLAPGTYYYASRFELNNCSYVYGGTGGIWNNDSVELIVTADQVDFCNVDYPKTGTAIVGGTFNVYTQAYEPGLTNVLPVQAPGLQAWIGYSSTDIPPYTSPASWTWVSTTYDSDFGNNDQYVANIMGGPFGITSSGTYYFASRWQLNGSSYSYGGIFDDNMGNFWDPVTNNNGILTVTNAPCSDLIISEYVEGSSLNKYLEIFNGTGAAINLSNYQISLYSNGSLTPTTQGLSGSIPNGGVIVYRHPSAPALSVPTTILTPNNPINFNGNDAVALVNSGAIIDVIGQIGFNPGTEWTGGSVSTLNRTLRRKSTVQVGDADGSNAFNPNDEWLSFPINSVSELGYHFNGCYPDRELQLELPVGTVVYCGHDYDFGSQIVNTNTDVVLRLRNLGTLPLQITSLALATGAQYTLVAPPATPFTIPGGNFEDITIRFNPTALGLLLDTLTIGSDDASEGSCTIDLSGIALSNCDTIIEIIAAQDFESSPTDTWVYIADHAPLSPFWDVMNSLPDIASAQSGASFWGMTDLERSGHINETHELGFTQDITAYSNVEFSFHYYTTNLDPGDTFEYELFYNGVSQGIVDISTNTGAWTQVLINIPNSVNLFQIVFYADIDAANDNAGLDNLLLTSTILNTATWDGNWNWNDGTALNTPPTSSTTVVLASNYDTFISGSFEACQLFINPSYTLNIANGTYVEVENFTTIDGAITVQTHGSFVQRADFSNGFVINPGGSASVIKSTSVINNWYDYTYWSAPVSGTTVGAAIDIAPSNRRFYFDAVNYLDVFRETDNDNTLVPGHDDIDDNNDDWIVAPAGMPMAPGQGFAATVLNSGPFPGTRQITFDGPFNTGTITTPVFFNGDNGDNDWNLIGNPYPSAISFNDLYDANSAFIDGAAYLWSHSTIPPSNTNNGNQAQNFSDDYAIINRFSGNTAGGSGVTPDLGNFIPSGQSFFIKGLSNGVVTINNDMRMANTTSNNQFFRIGDSRPNKFWINLTSNNGVFNQLLVAYVEGATNADDGMAYDATRNLSSGVKSAIYSLIDGAEDKKYAIQGKNPNSLTLNEIIHLGFYTSIAEPTTYKLSIADFQGAFLTANTLYLKDNLLNLRHDLSLNDYIFSSQPGEFNNRFEIVFREQALSVIENEITANDLSIIELPNGQVKFIVGNNLNIDNVEIIDMLGRTFFNLKGNSPSEIYELSNLSQAAYIAKVTLSNGQVITKRAIKRR